MAVRLCIEGEIDVIAEVVDFNGQRGLALKLVNNETDEEVSVFLNIAEFHLIQNLVDMLKYSSDVEKFFTPKDDNDLSDTFDFGEDY